MMTSLLLDVDQLCVMVKARVALEETYAKGLEKIASQVSSGGCKNCVSGGVFSSVDHTSPFVSRVALAAQHVPSCIVPRKADLSPPLKELTTACQSRFRTPAHVHVAVGSGSGSTPRQNGRNSSVSVGPMVTASRLSSRDASGAHLPSVRVHRSVNVERHAAAASLPHPCRYADARGALATRSPSFASAEARNEESIRSSPSRCGARMASGLSFGRTPCPRTHGGKSPAATREAFPGGIRLFAVHGHLWACHFFRWTAKRCQCLTRNRS